MEQRTELARGVIAADHTITIQLVGRPHDGRIVERIAFDWPHRPTTIEPSRLAATTARFVTVVDGT
jgi:hypothetical protein